MRWLWLASASAQHIWDDQYALALATRHVRLAREAGALGELPLALTQRVFVHIFAGELGAAEALVAEIHAAMESIGSELVPYAAVALAGIRGREPEAAPLIDRGRKEGSQRGEGVGLTVLDWAEAVLENGLSRPAQARAVALGMLDRGQFLVEEAQLVAQEHVLAIMPTNVEEAARYAQGLCIAGIVPDAFREGGKRDGVPNKELVLAGIIFSIAMVMVQFSAIAYSPRLVAWFGNDPTMFHSLGIFFATFTYSYEAQFGS